MSRYLLSTYGAGGDGEEPPNTPEEMQAFMERVVALEAEMEEDERFVFSGRLHGPDASTVVRSGGAETMLTDGPFVESKEHIAGFYIIEADDLDEALGWGRKVAEATGHAIEVRPFAATGRVADHMG